MLIIPTPDSCELRIAKLWKSREEIESLYKGRQINRFSMGEPNSAVLVHRHSPHMRDNYDLYAYRHRKQGWEIQQKFDYGTYIPSNPVMLDVLTPHRDYLPFMEGELVQRQQEIDEWKRFTRALAKDDAPADLLRAFAMECSNMKDELERQRAHIDKMKRERNVKEAKDVEQILASL